MNNFDSTWSVNARWIFLLLLEFHLLRTDSGFTCLTVSLRWTWSIASPHRQTSVIVALHQVLRRRRAEKNLSHAHESTGNVRSSLKSHKHMGTSQRQHNKFESASVLTNCKLQRYILLPICQPLVEDHLVMASHSCILFSCH